MSRTWEQLHKLAKRNGGWWECFYCDRPIFCGHCLKWFVGKANQATKDHVIPKANGGNNGLGNLVLSCRRCNKLKETHVFAQEKPTLADIEWARHLKKKKPTSTPYQTHDTIEAASIALISRQDKLPTKTFYLINCGCGKLHVHTAPTVKCRELANA